MKIVLITIRFCLFLPFIHWCIHVFHFVDCMSYKLYDLANNFHQGQSPTININSCWRGNLHKSDTCPGVTLYIIQYSSVRAQLISLSLSSTRKIPTTSITTDYCCSLWAPQWAQPSVRSERNPCRGRLCCFQLSIALWHQGIMSKGHYGSLNKNKKTRGIWTGADTKIKYIW